MERKIKPGVYLHGSIGVRRVGAETEAGFEYLQFHPSHRSAFHGYCSDSVLLRWGTIISEQEARQLIPNMDEQESSLHSEQTRQGSELAAKLEPLIIAGASDQALIAELEKRGYKVHRA